MNNLVDKSKPWGTITFLHHKTGKKHEFYSCINRLSGNRLSAFDNNPPSIDDNLRWVKSVFKDINSKCKILAFEGTIKTSTNK
jgi:hypothetical protein